MSKGCCVACDEFSDDLDVQFWCPECREHFEHEDTMRDEEFRQALEAEECELDIEDRIDEGTFDEDGNQVEFDES